MKKHKKIKDMSVDEMLDLQRKLIIADAVFISLLILSNLIFGLIMILN